jgi:hypothetical protein
MFENIGRSEKKKESNPEVKGRTGWRKTARIGSRSVAAGIFLMLFFVSSVAFPGDMPLRCKSGSMVQIGDDEDSVLRKCGKPDSVRRTNPEKQTIRGHWVELKPELEYTYNMGSSDYIYLLTIKQGKVTDIATAGRGTAKPGD